MNINRVVVWFEKYSFLFISLYCFSFFTPNLMAKIPMMSADASVVINQMSGSNIIKQVFWLLFFTFLIWRTCRHNILAAELWKKLFILVFMTAGLAFISALWSEYPLLTIKRGGFQLIFCFSIFSSLFFAKRHDAIGVSLYWIAILIIGMIILSIVMGIAFTSGGNLAGFVKGKNELGQNLLVLIALMILQIKLFGQRFPNINWLFLILSLLLLLTISKTSITLLILFVLFGFTKLRISKLLINSLFFISFAIFIFIPAFSFFLGEYTHIGMYLNYEALTGRVFIWDVLYYDLDYFSKMGFGYGYGVYFGNGTTPYFFDDNWSFLQHITTAHNGYIDILLQYGVVFSLPIITCLYKLSTKITHCWLAAAFIIPIAFNLTESAFIKDQSIVWYFTVVLFFYVVIMKEKSINR